MKSGASRRFAVGFTVYGRSSGVRGVVQEQGTGARKLSHRVKFDDGRDIWVRTCRLSAGKV